MYRIEKRTQDGVVTYQPQITIAEDTWRNLIKLDVVEVATDNTMHYQRWDSIPQAKSVIDIFSKQGEQPKPIIEYIAYEPKNT